MQRQIIGLICLTFVFMGGCATTGPTNDEAVSQLSGNFATNLNIVVDYLASNNRVWLVVDIENPRAIPLEAWLIQKNITPGQWASSGERFYSGNDKLKQTTFRLDVPKPGIEKVINVEVFDEKGNPLMVTEPIITNSQTEVTP